MERSWRTGQLVAFEQISTIADGIGVRLPVPEALTDLTGIVDDLLLVDDSAMLSAMRLAHRELGLVLEPSGAVALAALRSDPARFRGQLVGAILCGGNLTPAQIAEWLSE